MPGPPSIRHLLKRTEQLAKRYGLNLLHRAVFHELPPSGNLTTDEYLSQPQHGGDHKQVRACARMLQNHLPSCDHSQLPQAFHYGHEILSPEQFVVSLEHGRVFGRGVVVTASDQVLKDVSLEISFPKQSHSLCLTGRLPSRKHFSGKLGVVASRGPGNYYHWLYDILPRFGLLSSTDVDAFYVDNTKSFQREYLGFLGIGSERIVPARRYGHWEADILQVASLPGTSGIPSMESVAFLRQFLRFGVSDKRGSPSRIYIGRGDVKRRRVLNEPAVMEGLRHFGFTNVTLSGMSVAQQIALFANAEIVVAPHGAGLSNLVYCNPGAAAIELFAPQYVNVCYWTLAERCELKYSYLLGNVPSVVRSPIGETNAAHVGDDISVDVAKLMALVRGSLEGRLPVAA